MRKIVCPVQKVPGLSAEHMDTMKVSPPDAVMPQFIVLVVSPLVSPAENIWQNWRSVGAGVGGVDGALMGMRVGGPEGAAEGKRVGRAEGIAVGLRVGNLEGAGVGAVVGV